MKVQNQKTSNYKDEIQKENFTGEKPKMAYITGGKTLLTLKKMTFTSIVFFVLLTSASVALVKKLNVEIKDMIYIEKSNISTFIK